MVSFYYFLLVRILNKMTLEFEMLKYFLKYDIIALIKRIIKK
ncbi:hypothetical protein JOC47_002835 [Halanaerobacter jeridensis]|uniref:Uncharacterized protein n=1 Tax=Halanaerobacter jeridensis TaxID=706427 RepID=A0A938XXA9_9FIRM|nr:hypothetical protein [Halanaerobacter jeridensis]